MDFPKSSGQKSLDKVKNLAINIYPIPSTFYTSAVKCIQVKCIQVKCIQVKCIQALVKFIDLHLTLALCKLRTTRPLGNVLFLQRTNKIVLFYEQSRQTSFLAPFMEFSSSLLLEFDIKLDFGRF